MTLHRFVAGLACLLVAGCTAPPPTAYIGAGPGAGAGVALGRDAAGESCLQLAGGMPRTVSIYCGGWTQPAARVAETGAGTTSALRQVATSGPWRDQLDQRFACGAPTATAILNGAPALVLRCTRRIGGWPQIALVASVRGRIFAADGIAPTLPVMQRAIGVMSGMSSATAAALPPSAADTLLAGVLAAQAFSAGDAAQYQRLMQVGAHANLAENFAAAETADRAALALQQRLLGRDNPNTVAPLMDLALQISDQGRFPEATSLLARAAELAPRAADPVVPARLLHDRALNALNQGHDAAALALLRRAGATYAALLPAGALATAPTGGAWRLGAASGAAASGQGLGLPAAGLTADPTVQSALLGLIETWRYQAVALRRQGNLPAAEAAIGRAQALAQANGLDVPLVTARLVRTAAVTDAARGRLVPAEAGLAQATAGFGQVLPRTRPVAETQLLQAADAVRQGRTQRAIRLCRAGTKLLRELEIGANPDLLAPCLAAFDRAAADDPADRQALFAEMFETAELGQGSVTSRQIAEASARLAIHARNPLVAEAIRRRQDAVVRLDALYRQRDALARGPASGTRPSEALPQSPAALDAAIGKAEATLAEASAAVQAAAPNYRQLVQQVVPAAAVLKALEPHEAYVGISLADHGGWTFLLRDGRIAVARLADGRAQIARLVRDVRATIEPDDQGHLPAFDTKAAAAIYQTVLAPVSAGLKGASSLVVAPSGALLSIPFGILLTGPAKPGDLAAAPWLIRQMPISYVPAAANFVSLRKLAKGSHAPDPWFGFGDPRPVSLAQAERTYPRGACADSARLFAGLPELPFSLRELTAARELLGGSPADELTGPAFTTTAVAKVDLKKYRVLHFATHAILPSELRCQSQPAIVTSAPAGASSAAGALLTSGEVLGLDLDANTVILSACNSGGIGLHSGGESLSALARAFFFAGARSMMVTHWAISDQASAFLVAETMRRYAAGQRGGLAADLRAAKLTMINGAGKSFPAALADPFFWGAFALVGEGRITGAPTS
ncbi:MAG: CHAT domain-containing protein [Rhodospirillales bacterium]|nr:CHAT domain-containing protein [Rhodospirillales bacterium]